MITIIICAIIGLIIGILNEVLDSYWDFGGIFFCGFIGIFVGGIIGFIIAFSLPMKYSSIHITQPIECLQDNSSISGSFFLGSGQINGKMMYVFYGKEPNGNFKMYQIDYNYSEIKYTDSKPVVKQWYTGFTHCTWNYFALDLQPEYATYVFEVPKGSIQTNYNLDAK